mgnify:CR=1 FL=1
MKKNSSGGTATQQKSAEAEADEQKIATPAPANVAPQVPGPGAAPESGAAPMATAAPSGRPGAEPVTFTLEHGTWKGDWPVPPKNAAGDKHAESALAATQVAYSEHQKLVADVRAAETRHGARREKMVADLVGYLEDEIGAICDGPSGWLDPEVKMDGIHGLRAKVAEKRHTISRLTGAADLEAARENLRQFEEGHPLFAQRAPVGDGPVMAAKREAAKARVDALKPSLEPMIAALPPCVCGHPERNHATSDEDGPHDGPCLDALGGCKCKAFKEAKPGKPKPMSEGAAKLVNLLGATTAPAPAPVVYAGPVLLDTVRADLASVGFAWSGKVTVTPIAKDVENAMGAWKKAKASGAKARLEDAERVLSAYGWVHESKVPAPLFESDIGF